MYLSAIEVDGAVVAARIGSGTIDIGGIAVHWRIDIHCRRLTSVGVERGGAVAAAEYLVDIAAVGIDKGVVCQRTVAGSVQTVAQRSRTVLGIGTMQQHVGVVQVGTVSLACHALTASEDVGGECVGIGRGREHVYEAVGSVGGGAFVYHVGERGLAREVGSGLLGILIVVGRVVVVGSAGAAEDASVDMSVEELHVGVGAHALRNEALGSGYRGSDASFHVVAGCAEYVAAEVVAAIDVACHRGTCYLSHEHFCVTVDVGIAGTAESIVDRAAVEVEQGVAGHESLVAAAIQMAHVGA